MNEIGIQMLSQPMHEQVFKNCESKTVNTESMEFIKEHLDKHKLWGKEGQVLPDVNFTLPELKGNNIDEHFRHLANKQLEPYLIHANEIVNCEMPAMPSEWVFEEGWTMYTPDGKSVKVDFPLEKALVFDVEVLMEEHPFPTMATAVSSKAW